MTRDKDTEARLLVGRALDVASSVLSKAEEAEVQGFLDVNENALALETLVGIFVEERRIPPSTLKSIVIAAATAMAMDASRLESEMDRLEGS